MIDEPRLLLILENLKIRYLDRLGWTESMRQNKPIDVSGSPMPWITYPAWHFLRPRLRKHFKVFEYGSGASTLSWAARVHSVVSVEHDERWFQAMTPKIPDNVQYIFRRFEGTTYPEEILNHPPVFDVVMVDGRKRVRSAIAASQRLTSNGVIVWDNSERRYYQPGFDHLTGLGFRRIDFIGLGPARDREWMTTVFYRADNCLGI